MQKLISSFVVVLLLGSVVTPAGAATQQADGFAGTHVSFETAENAVVDYSVDGETMIDSVAVQSGNAARSEGGLGADVGLSAVTSIAASAVSLESQTSVSATIRTESGAEMEAHDNSRGILVIASGEESQYVVANVSESADVETEGDQRAVVTTENGTEGTFIVVGDGEITTNDGENVSAEIASDSKLVFRSYTDGRDDEDEQEEQYIADGKAAAEVYVMEAAESGSDLSSDVVSYSEDTTVEVTQQTEGTVKMTANRSQEAGTILLTSVSEQAISSTEDLSVTVDGEAAAEASSRSDLESAVGSNSSMYLVSELSAEASTDVLVAVNHFSDREVEMDASDSDSNSPDGGSEDGSDGDSDGDQDATSSDGPGFGAATALVALLATAMLASRRRD